MYPLEIFMLGDVCVYTEMTSETMRVSALKDLGTE